MSRISPSKPSSRSPAAARAPASEAPTITIRSRAIAYDVAGDRNRAVTMFPSSACCSVSGRRVRCPGPSVMISGMIAVERVSRACQARASDRRCPGGPARACPVAARCGGNGALAVRRGRAVAPGEHPDPGQFP
jgi:hypothetical protein